MRVMKLSLKLVFLTLLLPANSFAEKSPSPPATACKLLPSNIAQTYALVDATPVLRDWYKPSAVGF